LLSEFFIAERRRAVLTAQLRARTSVQTKQIVAQLAKKFPASYGTEKFITMLTKERKWIIS
jgi:hypothetical protein